jgi:predicted metal-dependent hydrolase
VVELVIDLDQDSMLVEIVRKPIKNVYIRVARTDGRIRITAPSRTSDDALIIAVRKHHPWILRRQQAIARQPTCRNPPLEHGDTIQVFGTKHRLELVEGVVRPHVSLGSDGVLSMCVRSGLDKTERRAVLERWYRDQLRERIPALIEAWEPVIGVSVAEWRIKHMRTRWGSCNIRARRIWLNLELARRPIECLEYVVVHEMVHLLEPGHNKRFYGLMDQFLPGWRAARKNLRDGAIC